MTNGVWFDSPEQLDAVLTAYTMRASPVSSA